MHRLFAFISALLLGIAACSGPAAETPSTTPVAGLTTATNSVTTVTETETSTTSKPTESTDSASERPLAPDFTLELGDGASFTLSEGAKPVYLVFWAEW